MEPESRHPGFGGVAVSTTIVRNLRQPQAEILSWNRRHAARPPATLRKRTDAFHESLLSRALGAGRAPADLGRGLQFLVDDRSAGAMAFPAHVARTLADGRAQPRPTPAHADARRTDLPRTQQ